MSRDHGFFLAFIFFTRFFPWRGRGPPLLNISSFHAGPPAHVVYHPNILISFNLGIGVSWTAYIMVRFVSCMLSDILWHHATIYLHYHLLPSIVVQHPVYFPPRVLHFSAIHISNDSDLIRMVGKIFYIRNSILNNMYSFSYMHNIAIREHTVGSLPELLYSYHTLPSNLIINH